MLGPTLTSVQIRLYFKLLRCKLSVWVIWWYELIFWVWFKVDGPKKWKWTVHKEDGGAKVDGLTPNRTVFWAKWTHDSWLMGQIRRSVDLKLTVLSYISKCETGQSKSVKLKVLKWTVQKYFELHLNCTLTLILPSPNFILTLTSPDPNLDDLKESN